jgi:hypothetical protein
MRVNWLNGAKVIEFNPDAWNAPSPILVTLDGMLMLFSELAFRNAELPMLVTPSGMTTAPAQLPPS